MADTLLNLNPRTPKIARQEPDWTKCICHVREEQGDLSGFNDQSWSTLRCAAEIRQDQIFLKLKDHWDKGPIGVKHRKWYQAYTNKTLLDRLKKWRDESSVSDAMPLSEAVPTAVSPMEPEIKRSSRTLTSVPQTEEVCIFCQKKRKRCGKEIFFFFLLWFNVPVNNFSVMLRWSHLFLGNTSTFWGVNVSCSRKQTHRPGRGSNPGLLIRNPTL